MSFEWRIFFPVPQASTSSPDLWQLLGHKPRWGPPEERTDDYIACTDDVGVKLRGQKTLEVKVRGGPVATCGAELWRKVERSRVDTSKDLQGIVSRELLQLSTIHEQYRPVLEGALKEIQGATSGLTLVSLRKKRRCGYVKHVAVEQTDIEVVSGNSAEKQCMSMFKAGTGHQVRGNPAAGQLAQPCPMKWRSVSFEEEVVEPSHQQPSNIEALLESLGASKGDPLPPVFKEVSAKIMSYPQFVLEVESLSTCTASK